MTATPEHTSDSEPKREPPAATPPPPPSPPPSQRTKSGSGCGAKLLGGLAIAIVVGFLAFSIGVATGGALGQIAGGAQLKSNLAETVLQSGDHPSQGAIAIIPIRGVIMGQGNHLSGSDMVYDVASKLRAAARSDHVKAVILDIDSPGGGLTPSDVLHHEVLRLKETGKPVVVSVGNLAASGGYYIAAPADYIVAAPTSLVGSISVIIPHIEATKLLQKIGIDMTSFKSGHLKDLGAMYKEMTEEEKQKLQFLIDHWHARFVDIVASGRNLSRDKVSSLATGWVFPPQKALDEKLIDEIGYFDTAVSKAAKLANISGSPRLIGYSRPKSFADLFKPSPLISAEELSRVLEASAYRASSPDIRLQWTGDSAPDPDAR